MLISLAGYLRLRNDVIISLRPARPLDFPRPAGVGDGETLLRHEFETVSVLFT